jgi:Cys-tRNA(Pro)/Cys-tRNA(Cys) deacylase
MTAQHDAVKETPAIREVAASGIPFRVVRTGRPESAEESASLQGIEVGQLIRSIVVRRGAGDYVFVLVPGGRQIDWGRLRAHLGVHRLSLPDQDEAREATGYERGTITPFASSTTWPVVADASLADRDLVAIGAGAHGVNMHVNPADLVRVLEADVADVTDPRPSA